jgi:hypothetical protein
MTANIKDARRAVLEPICSEYNIKEHYNLNYIQTVVNKFITLFELTNNPLLDQRNSEGFFQVHVFGLLIDQLFFDVPGLQVVRGEMASRAVSFRKNMSRKLGNPKLASTKLDAALLTRDTWRVELLAMESGLNDSLEGQSKFLSDRRKLARGLKDQLDLVYACLPEDQKSMIVDIEVFGVLTSGLECRVYVMDLPCSGLYRFAEVFHVALPQQFDSYMLLLKALARFLTLKQRILSVLTTLERIKTSTARRMLAESLIWSPQRPSKTDLTRSTPISPTPTKSGVARPPKMVGNK